MKKLFSNKFTYTIGIVHIFLSIFFIFTIAHAQQLASFRPIFSQTPSSTADDGYQVYDIDSTHPMRITGTLDWTGSFTSPFPYIALGDQGTHNLAGYPYLGCSVSGDSSRTIVQYNPMSWNPNAYNICSIGANNGGTQANNSVAYSMTGNFVVYASPTAVPGTMTGLIYFGSNDGSSPEEQPFHIRIKPLACVINSFTALQTQPGVVSSPAVLAWDVTSNGNPISIDQNIGDITDQVANTVVTPTLTTTYTLTCGDKTRYATVNVTHTSTSLAATSTPTVGFDAPTVSVPDGVDSLPVTFYYWNAGEVGSTLHVKGCGTTPHTPLGIDVAPQCSGTFLRDR